MQDEDDIIKDQGNINEELAKVGITPKLPACGNPKCSVSTGIHEGLTFGHGKLDNYGYWEHPCPICARNWDSKRNEEIAYFKELYKNHKRAETGLPIEDLDKFLHEQHEWLFIEAWPFPRESYGPAEEAEIGIEDMDEKW